MRTSPATSPKSFGRLPNTVEQTLQVQQNALALGSIVVIAVLVIAAAVHWSAEPAVRAAANDTTESTNEDDGVAAYLERVYNY